MVTQVSVPDIGSFRNVPIIELLVQAGDVIEVDQPLMTLESDKATLEVPAPRAGVVQQVLVKLGDRVSQGTPILMLEAGEAAEVAEVAAPGVVPAADVAPMSVMEKSEVPEVEPVAPPRAVPSVVTAPALSEVAEAALVLAHASPTVRRYARELGVDLGQVRGTGPKNRVLRDDVQAFVKSALAAHSGSATTQGWPGLPEWPEVDFAQYGPIEVRPLSRVQKLSGAYLHRNWLRIPHVTNHEEVDITELEAFRQMLNREKSSQDAKVTVLTLVIKALAALLPNFPTFNASLQGDGLVFKRYVNIGFAADTPQGLLVPVVRDVPTLGVRQLALKVADLAREARDGKLSPEAMQGGTFSVSSLGGIGGSFFTPIINAPEVAILGLGRAVQKPVWLNGAVEPRWLLPISLSYDHRVIDGASAARFNEALRRMLTDLRRILL